jgi:integrase
VSASKANASRYKRLKTRHPGITYRLKDDGSRTYYVYAAGKQIAVQGGEREALAKQSELRGKLARGEKVASNRKTFDEVAEEWLATKRTRLREKTLIGYEAALENHLRPYFGKFRITRIDEDAVAAFVVAMQRKTKTRKDGTVVGTLKGWTIQGALTPLSGIFRYAVRKGYMPRNPLVGLDRAERPRKGGGEKRILAREEIARLIDSAEEKYRPLIVTAIFSGLRLGELLGLQWRDLDEKENVLYVRRQWTQASDYSDPKTLHAIREVVIPPFLTKALIEHRLATVYCSETDPIFASDSGKPLGHRNVAKRGLDPAAVRAGIVGEPRLTFHQLRHTYASMMIDEGMNPVQLSLQMGHANPNITLSTYAHLFDRHSSRERVKSLVESAVGKSLASTAGNATETDVLSSV